MTSTPTTAPASLRKRVFDLLFNENNPEGISAKVNRWLVSLILLNVMAMVLETSPYIDQTYSRELDWLELFSVVVFSVEYLLRLWVAPEDPDFRAANMPRLKYIFSLYAIIDLLAIMPFYLSGLITLDLRVLRMMRLVRVFKFTAFIKPAWQEFQHNTQGMTVRQKVYSLLMVSPEASGHKLAHFIDTFFMFWIVVSTLSIVLDSVDSIQAEFATHFFIIDAVAFSFFAIEYGLRLYASAEERNGTHAFADRWRFATSFSGLIDLMSILPLILELLIGSMVDLRFLRIVRLLRLLKMTRYSSATSTLFAVCKREAPILLASSFVMGMLVFITAAMGYLLEKDAQPDKFESIPAALYWAVITLASVGYGDITPVTAAGRFLTVLLALMGIGVFAIPAAIMSSAFTDQLRIEREGGGTAAPSADAPAAPTHTPSAYHLASNPDYAWAHYQTLLAQIRELTTLADAQAMQDKLAQKTSVGAVDREIWQLLQGGDARKH